MRSAQLALLLAAIPASAGAMTCEAGDRMATQVTLYALRGAKQDALLAQVRANHDEPGDKQFETALILRAFSSQENLQSLGGWVRSHCRPSGELDSAD